MLPKKTLVACFATLVMFAAYGQVKDVDGNEYGTVKLGDQEWTSSNLAVTKFRNGDPIPHAPDEKSWKAAIKNGTPAWCYPDGKEGNGKKHGLLYNWYAVSDTRGIAPEGWHVPSQEEWETLKEYMGDNYPKKDMKAVGIELRNTTDWPEQEKEYEYTGFNALASGLRNDKAKYKEFGIATFDNYANLWSSTGKKKVAISTQILRASEAAVTSLGTQVMATNARRATGAGLSVRCVKD